MQGSPLLTLFLIVASTIGIGWLLVIGQSIILPVITAIILVYVLEWTVAQFQRLPLVSALPHILLRMAALVIFGVVLYALSVVVSSTVHDMIALAPTYEENIKGLISQLETSLGLPPQSILDEAVSATLGLIDVQTFLRAILGGATTAGASAFMVVLYAAFLLAERGQLSTKLFAAFPERAQAAQLEETVNDINRKIGEYLAVKTLINAILAAACWGVMALLGTDFALFWAIAIGLANYIPYVGSWVGVLFPVVLSAAQTGSLWQTLLLASLLTAAQIVVGSVLEPRMIGRQLNLSPFVVILALSLWSSLWGLAGAILAVPMTSILVIILAQYPATRPLTVLVSDRVTDPSAASG